MVSVFLPILIMMVINFGISWFNAKNVGHIWTESKEVGGNMRLTAIAGYVMSIAGFTMVYSMILLFLSPYVLPMVSSDFSQAEIQSQVIILASDLIYIIGIFTILPSAYIIWFHSARVFWERKTIRNGLVLGWNTFATISNTMSAVRNVPGALGRIKQTLTNDRKNSSNGMIIMLAIVIVLAAILGGYFTASAIMKRADRQYDYFDHMKEKYDKNPDKYARFAN